MQNNNGMEILLIIMVFAVGIVAYNEYQQVQVQKANAAALQAQILAQRQGMDPITKTLNDIEGVAKIVLPFLPALL